MSGGFVLREMNGDLFTAPSDYALAHCVTTSMIMGAGIAVQFKKRFGRVQELKNQKVPVGGVAILKHESRFLYYLVTKNGLYVKPTYDNLKLSLEAMKKHMVENNVQRLAIPQIGCGIDRLEWPKVKQLLMDVFSDTDMEIVVYIFP